MKWLSLLKVRSALLADIGTQHATAGASYSSASRYSRDEYDRYEDEGSSSMFTIIGPLRQLARAADQAVNQAVNQAVGQAVSQAAADPVRTPMEPRVDPAPAAPSYQQSSPQPSPVKTMKLFFDDTVNYDASDSLTFR